MQRGLEPVGLLGVEPPVPRARARAARRRSRVEAGQQLVGRRRRSRWTTDRSLRQLVDQRRRCAAMPCSCWSISTSRVTSGVTFGLPSRSPPIQVPKVSGRAVGGSSTPSARQLGRRGRRARRRPRRRQVVEVVDGVAGLVGGSGRSSRSSSVCQSRSMTSASRRSCRRGRRRLPGVSSSSATARSLVRIERRAASVGWAVNTGRTASRATASAQLARRQPGGLIRVGGLGQPAALAGPLGRAARGPGAPAR